MFRPQRFFCQFDSRSGNNAWFIETREGVLGPYATRHIAEVNLARFRSQKLKARDTGGRSDVYSIVFERSVNLFTPNVGK
jgi:hypothetical protein